MPDLTDAKRTLRRRWSAERQAITDQAERSVRICLRLRSVIDGSTCRTIMLYDAVPGEPDLHEFADWCRAEGIVVVRPAPTRDADHPVEPSVLDAAVVPGLAFTRDGDRLGRGGGWYDRLLALVTDDCVVVGVCFAEQIVEALPVEPHDVRLDLVVSDAG